MALQTSSGSNREAWVIAFLPAAIILMGYMLFVTFFRYGTLRELREEHERVAGSAVTEDQLFSLHQENQKLKGEQTALEETIRATEEELDALAAPFRSEGKSHTTKELSRLCRKHSIGVLSQQPAVEVPLSPLREQAVNNLRERVGNDDAHVSQMDVRASYSNITNFLEELPQGIPGALPIGLELLEPEEPQTPAETANRPERIWRLILLM